MADVIECCHAEDWLPWGVGDGDEIRKCVYQSAPPAMYVCIILRSYLRRTLFVSVFVLRGPAHV